VGGALAGGTCRAGLKARGIPSAANRRFSMHALAFPSADPQAGDLQSPRCRLGLLFNMGRPPAVATNVSVLKPQGLIKI